MSRTAAGDWANLLEQGAADGEAEAQFALVVQRLSRLAFRIAYAVLRNAGDAEDVVQDAFFKLYRSGAWKHMSDEKAFMGRTVWRLAISKKPSQRLVSESEPMDVASGQSSPESAAIVTENSRRIHRIIDALPEKLRRALTLSSIQEMTTAEIAAVMRLPEGTVRRLIAEARALVKAKMARMEGFDR